MPLNLCSLSSSPVRQPWPPSTPSPTPSRPSRPITARPRSLRTLRLHRYVSLFAALACSNLLSFIISPRTRTVDPTATPGPRETGRANGQDKGNTANLRVSLTPTISGDERNRGACGLRFAREFPSYRTLSPPTPSVSFTVRLIRSPRLAASLWPPFQSLLLRRRRQASPQ